MSPTDPFSDTEVRLFVREDLPRPARRRQRRVTESFESLVGAAIDGFEVVRWPKRFERSGSDHEGVRQTYATFVEWATESDASLAPFFDVRECYSMETGRKRDCVVLPVLCAAIYEEGDLLAVYPHADADGTHSVEDCLQHLADEADGERRMLRA